MVNGAVLGDNFGATVSAQQSNIDLLQHINTLEDGECSSDKLTVTQAELMDMMRSTMIGQFVLRSLLLLRPQTL